MVSRIELDGRRVRQYRILIPPKIEIVSAKISVGSRIGIDLDRSLVHGNSFIIKTEKCVYATKLVIAQSTIRLNSYHLSKLLCRVAITPKEIETDAKSAVVLPIARPNLYCPLKAGHCSLHIAFALPASTQPFMSIITHWLKLGGHFELFNGAIKLAGPVIDDAQRYMYLRLIRVQHQRVIACRDCRIHPGAVV